MMIHDNEYEGKLYYCSIFPLQYLALLGMYSNNTLLRSNIPSADTYESFAFEIFLK
jgi:hypothetical protein